MDLTLNDLILMIEKLKEHNATQLHLDIGMTSWDEVDRIDFDIWVNGKFKETVLTKIY